MLLKGQLAVVPLERVSLLARGLPILSEAIVRSPHLGYGATFFFPSALFTFVRGMPVMTARPKYRGQNNRTDAAIIRDVYYHLVGENDWPKLLARITWEFECTYSVLIQRNKSTGSIRVVATDALAPKQQSAYESHYAQLQPASFLYNEHFGPGRIFTDGSYDDYCGYLSSEIYNDFFRPLDADHLLFLALRKGEATDQGLALRRSRRAGMFKRSECRRFEQIGSHVLNAERLMAMSPISRDDRNLRTILDALGTTAFITDQNARLIHTTNAGEAFLATGGILAVSNGRLVARGAGLADELQAAIRSCAATIDNPDMSKTWKMFRVPSENIEDLSPVLSLSAIVWLEAGAGALPACLIVVTKPRDERIAAASQVGRLFGLTTAESNLAVALCLGSSLAEYAVSRGISVQTARTLLKRTLGKTNSHSQRELISVILRSCPL